MTKAPVTVPAQSSIAYWKAFSAQFSKKLCGWISAAFFAPASIAVVKGQKFERGFGAALTCGLSFNAIVRQNGQAQVLSFCSVYAASVSTSANAAKSSHSPRQMFAWWKIFESERFAFSAANTLFGWRFRSDAPISYLWTSFYFHDYV